MKALAPLLALALAGCADGQSYVHVTVTGSLGDIDHLDVRIANLGQTASVRYAPGAPFQLPYDFALSLDKTRHGPATITVDAWAPDHLLASGTVSTTIVPSHGADIAVSLEPQAGGDDLGAVADLAGGAADLGAADLTTPPDFTGVAPYLGDSNVEGNVDNHAVGLADASNFVATATGSVTSLSVYYSSGDATELLIGLYDDQSNHPHALLAQGSVSSPVVGSWATATITATPVTSGTAYWIALVAPTAHGTNFSFPYGTGASGPTTTEHSSQSNLSTMPAFWSTGATFPGTFCSFYASP